MFQKFTREHISSGHAKFFIFCAGVATAIPGLVTLVAILRNTPGVTRLALIDVAICVVICVGLARRQSWAAWVGLGYMLLNLGLKFLRGVDLDYWGRLAGLIMYPMAAVSTRLYPRGFVRTPPKKDPESISHEAV